MLEFPLLAFVVLLPLPLCNYHKVLHNLTGLSFYCSCFALLLFVFHCIHMCFLSLFSRIKATIAGNQLKCIHYPTFLLLISLNSHIKQLLTLYFGHSTAIPITKQQFVSYTSDIENRECCERMFMQIRCNDGKSNYCYIVGQSVLHCLSEQKRWLKSWVAVEAETNKKVMCGCGDNMPPVFPMELGHFII